MSVLPSDGITFEIAFPVVVVGGGAAGLVAALRARERGRDVLVLERDPLPRGSTALSAGLIPAGGTRWQKALGIADSAALAARDIMAKADGLPDPDLVRTVTEAVGPALEWLADAHGLAFSVIDNFRYPGHSAYRMHGLPSRSGAELMDALREAASGAGVDILCGARVTRLYADGDRIVGVEATRPDGSTERIGCDTLILACNGYGGNRALVTRYIPAVADALYFGHPGNQGEAVQWGETLNAAMRDLSGHQGHGSVAHPHGILITWATTTEGGFQVNAAAERFSDESHGYSEQAMAVLAQPGGVAWSIFDSRIAGIARQFDDFRQAEAVGAVIVADDVAALAGRLGLDPARLAETFASVAACKATGTVDRFGRNFVGVPQLTAPFHAVKVTGALFHTQGGLMVDRDARVLKADGTVFPNLFAAGGAACGVSGPHPSGYLSGNGLLTAVALGWLAGAAA